MASGNKTIMIRVSIRTWLLVQPSRWAMGAKKFMPKKPATKEMGMNSVVMTASVLMASFMRLLAEEDGLVVRIRGNGVLLTRDRNIRVEDARQLAELGFAAIQHGLEIAGRRLFVAGQLRCLGRQQHRQRRIVQQRVGLLGEAPCRVRVGRPEQLRVHAGCHQAAAQRLGHGATADEPDPLILQGHDEPYLKWFRCYLFRGPKIAVPTRT